MLPDLAIGGLPVEPGLVLAPMSGVTDSPFRRLVREASGGAVGLVVSEFISVELLTRRNMRSVIRMAFDPSERPISLQIYGADPGRMAEAARMVEDAGADLLDVNCGCPAPKIVRRGGGAGLLRDLPVLARILDEVKRAVRIPVTVKIRSGWDEDDINALETLRVAEEHGAAAVAVHGRTRMQLYRGEADWGIVRRMVEVAKVPVLGSGDVERPEDALRRFRETGCAGILIGRAAVTNPWIFRQAADLAAGRAPLAPTWGMRLGVLERYLAGLEGHYPAKVVPGRVKMMASRLLKGLPGGAAVRVECLRQADPRAALRILDEHLAASGLRDTTECEGPGGEEIREAA